MQNKTKNARIEMCLSRVIHYRHVPIAVANIIWVVYKLVRSHQQTVKMLKRTLIVKSVSQTPYTVAECQLINYDNLMKLNFFKTLGVLLSVNVYPVIKLKMTQL